MPTKITSIDLVLTAVMYTTLTMTKKQKELADRKGGARILANDLRAKHSESDTYKRSRMAKEAEERQKVLVQLEQEEL